MATFVSTVIVIAVTVAPGPIFFLFFGSQLAEIPVFVAMVFARPLMVVHDFASVPHVVVAIVRVINPVMMMFGTGRAYYRRCQRGGKHA